jgi:O-antigen/teichoic acid export membrane protein
VTLARRTAFNTSALLASQLVQVLGGAIAIGVTTRYLGTDRFGAFVTATTFFSLFQMTSQFGLGPVSTRALSRFPERKPELLTTIMVLAWGLGAIGAACAILASFVAYPGDDNSSIRAAIAILSTQLVCAGPRAAADANITALQQSYLVAACWVFTRIPTLAAVIFVAAADLGFTAMVVAYAATSFLQTAGLVFFARRDLRTMRPTSWRAVKDHFRLALPMGSINIVNYLYFRLDLLLLSFLATPAAVARYGIAYKVIEMGTMLPTYIMATLMPELARRHEDAARFQRLFQQAFDIMLLLAVPVVLIGVFAEQILGVLGGPAYRDAGTVLQLMLLGLGAAYLQTVLGHALVAQGRQWLALPVSLIVLVVNLALNLALIPAAQEDGAAVALAISELLSLGLLAYRYGRAGPRPRFHVSWSQVLAGVAMLLAFLALRAAGDGLGWPDAVTVFAGGAIGSAAYAAVLLSRRALPVDITELLPRLRRGVDRRSSQPS